MKTVLNHIFKLANYAIIFQLVTMPLASGFDTRQRSGFGGENSDGFRDYSGFTNAAFQVSSFFNEAANAFLGVQQGPVDRTGEYINQLTPMLAVTPQPPGTYPAAFNGCVVLSSTPNLLNEGAKCENVPVQQILEGYATALIKVADDNLNAMNVASTASNDTTDFRGETCYQNAIAGLAQSFNIREEEIKTRVRALEEIIQNFELASQETLESIKQNDAILNGPCQGCREKNGVAARDYLEDFRFENVLFDANDNGACGSWYSENSVRERGGSSGLKGIEREITSRQIETADRFKGQREQIRNEIMGLTSSLASNFSRRNGFNASASNVTNRTTLFPATSPALSSAIERFNTRINNQIGDLETDLDLNNVLGQDRVPELSLLFNQVRAGSGDIGNIADQITLFERQNKAQCFRRNLSSALETENIGQGLRSFSNPNVSGNKSRNADSSMATALATEISTLDNSDFEEFLANVESIEMRGTNSLKSWRPGRTIDFGEGQCGLLNASERLRPSGLFRCLTSNCEDQFKLKRADLGGHSLNKMVTNLRNYATQMARLKETANGSLLSDIRKDLLTCPDDSSTGTADMSCNADRMSPSGGTFCMASAQRCMANVYNCQDKITAKITEAETQQQTLMTNYKAEVDTAKQQLMAEVASLEAFLLEDARRIDAELNLGTVTSTPGLQIDLTGTNFFRDDLRADLRLEDPEKYLEEIKKQLIGNGFDNPGESLLGSLRQQKEELIGQNGDDPTGDLRGKGRLGAMAAQYVDSYQDNADYYRDLISSCNQAIARANEEESRRLEALGEQNQEIADACDAVRAFNSNPLEGDVAEIASDASRAVRIAAGMPSQSGRFVNQFQDQREIERIRSFNQQCADDAGGFGSRNVSIGTICDVAKLDSKPSGDTEEEIWEMLDLDTRSRRERYQRDCASAGYISRRDIAGDEGQNYCREGEKPFGRDSDVCRLEQTRSAITQGLGGATTGITYKRGETTIERPSSIVAPSGTSCGNVEGYVAIATVDGEELTLPLSFTGFGRDNPPSSNDITFAGEISGRGTPRCLPGNEDDLEFDRDRRGRAEDELRNVAATFNCARAERSSGQVRLSICTADYDGFLSSKGIDPRLGSELATALGQAAAQ